MDLRKRLLTHSRSHQPSFHPLLAIIGTGEIAGVLTGLLGVGGGAVMVPLQMILLREPIKVAVQTSLGVLVATAASPVWDILTRAINSEHFIEQRS